MTQIISQGIYWLGQTGCGALGTDANIYCLSSQNIMMMGVTMLVMPLMGFVVLWILMGR
jgi:hypothetical protein